MQSYAKSARRRVTTAQKAGAIVAKSWPVIVVFTGKVKQHTAATRTELFGKVPPKWRTLPLEQEATRGLVLNFVYSARDHDPSVAPGV